MIENKEEYFAKRKVLFDKVIAGLDLNSTVRHLQTLYGEDAKLSDILKDAEAKAKKAIEEHQAFVKDVQDAICAINNKYSPQEILAFTANSMDEVDLANAFWSGKL